jgi:hypothetical protein
MVNIVWAWSINYLDEKGNNINKDFQEHSDLNHYIKTLDKSHLQSAMVYDPDKRSMNAKNT